MKQKLSQRATVHGPDEFDPPAYLTWLESSPELLGFDMECTPLENSRKTEAEHKRDIYYPGFGVRSVQVADYDTAWVLDMSREEHRTLFDMTTKVRGFISYTDVDPRAVKRSLGLDITEQTHDCYQLARMVDPAGFKQGLKDMTAKYLDSGLKEAEDALDAKAKATAPVGHRVGEKLQAHKWSMSVYELEFADYAGLDAIYVRHLYDILLRKLNNPALVKREHWHGRLGTSITDRGLLVDREYTEARYAEVKAEHDAAAERLWQVWNAPPRSPKRIDWLREHGVDFERLIAEDKVGLTDGGQSGDKKPKIDKYSIPLMCHEYAEDATLKPVLDDLQVISSTSNLVNNLRLMLQSLDTENRVHPRVKTLAAVTARQSVTGPPMQTFKKKDPRLRGCFIAEPGCTFIGCDFANVEVRVAGALAGDQRLIDMVTAGGSMHLNNASIIYGEEITKEDPRYGIAKIGTFATLYGAGDLGLASQLGIPVSESSHFRSNLLDAYPKTFVEYPRRMSKQKFVVTDWKRVIPAEWGFEYKNSNFAIQSTARELLLDAVMRLVDDYGVPMEYVFLMVHDEVILQVPTEHEAYYTEVLNKAMTDTYRGVPIIGEVDRIGDRWLGVGELAS